MVISHGHRSRLVRCDAVVYSYTLPHLACTASRSTLPRHLVYSLPCMTYVLVSRDGWCYSERTVFLFDGHMQLS